MLKKSYMWLGLLILVGLTVYFGVQSLPTEADRLVADVVRHLDDGDLENASLALERLADITEDSHDLAAVMSLRVVLSVARIAQENQLSLEYYSLATGFPEDHQLHQRYLSLGQQREAAMDARIDDMMVLARNYQGKHYQRGLRLRSPLTGTLHIPADESDYDEAYWRLVEQPAEENEAALERAVSRHVVGVLFGYVIVPDATPSADVLQLAGRLDLAELWWLVATNSPNHLFMKWSLERVIEETENSPAHPLREEASRVLLDIGG